MGVRVCGDVVWCYFWCGFAEIYILNCGIVVKILPKFSECSSDSIDCGKKKKKTNGCSMLMFGVFEPEN